MVNKILASLQKAISEFMKGPKKKMGERWDNMWYRWEGFEAKHRWIACFLVYGILFCSIISLCYLIFDIANLFYQPINETTQLRTNAAGGNVSENARSMLCTVIESEAAIVAIIISLTVIAVQFTASAYSPRVTDIMLSPRKNPDMFLLLFMYGIAIFSGLVLLKMEPFESRVPSEDVSVVLWLGIFLYLALVPYILRVTKLMKPKNIISVLLDDVTNDKILDYFKTVYFCWDNVPGDDDEKKKLKEFLGSNDFDIDWVENAKISKEDGNTIRISKGGNSAEITICDDGKKATLKITDGRTHKLKVKNWNGKLNIYKKTLKPAEDPVQPIVDIVYGSLRIYDLETIRYGLKKIVERIPGLINPGAREKLSRYFCDHLDRIGKLAASIADEDSTKEVIKSLEKIGKDTAEEGLVDATKKVVLALKDLGEAATEKGLKDAIEESAKSLGVVGEAAAAEEEGLEDTKKEDMIIASAKSLGVLGKAAAKKELEAATTQAAESLGAVGKTAAGKGLKKLEEAVKRVASSLGDVGEAAAGNELKDATEKVTSSLKEVGEAAVKKGKELEKAALQSVLSLEVVGKAAAGNGLKDATETAVSALVIVGKVAADEGLKEHVAVVKQVVSSLGIVGEAAAAVKELEDVVKQVVSSLGIVREAAAAVKELEDVVKQVASSLGAVGKAAAGNGLKDATEAATSSLEEVGEAAVEIGKELKRAASQAVLSLGDVGEAAAGNGLKAATAIAVAALGCVGEAAAGKGIELKTVTKRAVSSLEIIARSTAAKEGLKDVAKTAVSTLGTVGKAATGEGKGLEDVTKRVVLSIEAIGATAAKEGLEDVAETAVNALRIVGEAAAGKGIELKTVTKRAVLSIEAIGATAAKEGLKNVTEAAVKALSAVGITAEITELEDVARQAASSALAISSKEIVEAIIQDYESGVKKGSNYYKGLQKFKEHIQ